MRRLRSNCEKAVQQTGKGREPFELDFLCDDKATAPLLPRGLTDNRDGILRASETIQRTCSGGSG
jgi:hypothetical protein